LGWKNRSGTNRTKGNKNGNGKLVGKKGVTRKKRRLWSFHRPKRGELAHMKGKRKGTN